MKVPFVDRILNGCVLFMLTAYGAFITLPFAWIVITAFKRQIDVLMVKIVFEPTLGNFQRLLLAPGGTLLHNLFNSIFTAVFSTALVLCIGIISAFCLVHKRLPGWLPTMLLGLTMLFHIVPPITFISSWYVLFRQVGLFDTLPGLIFAHTAANLPIGLWLGVNYAREVPKELLEAAEIDCIGPWQQFREVFVPLMRNGLVAIGLLVFIFSWSDFLIALNLTASASQTLPVAITSFAQNEQIRYAEMAASSLLAMVPAMLMLLLGQRYIVQGLLSGSTK
jgi:multiple sugar transport system permease protein